MKRSKQRTLFEFGVFAKTKKWEGTDTVVVSGTYSMSNVAISDEMAPALMAVLQCECVTRWMWWTYLIVVNVVFYTIGIAVNGSIPWHSYGVSLAIWDHTVLPAARHKWTHPALTPARQAVRLVLDLPSRGMEGWVDLVDLIAPRGRKSNQSDLSITSPTLNHCTTKTTWSIFRPMVQRSYARKQQQPLYTAPVVDRRTDR